MSIEESEGLSSPSLVRSTKDSLVAGTTLRKSVTDSARIGLASFKIRGRTTTDGVENATAVNAKKRKYNFRINNLSCNYQRSENRLNRLVLEGNKQEEKYFSRPFSDQTKSQLFF